MVNGDCGDDDRDLRLARLYTGVLTDRLGVINGCRYDPSSVWLKIHALQSGGVGGGYKI